MTIEDSIVAEFSQFCEPVSQVSICGEDMEYNAIFQTIEQQIESVTEASQWRELLTESQKLLPETRDLRLAVIFTRVLVHTEKNAAKGLAKGLFTIARLLDQFWECVYPPIDDDDPEEAFIDRYNTLSILGGYRVLALPLRKKLNIVATNFDTYTLEELLAFKRGEGNVNGKQAPVGLDDNEQKAFDEMAESFSLAQQYALEIKTLFTEKTGQSFNEFDEYLLPMLEEGASLGGQKSQDNTQVATPLSSEASSGAVMAVAAITEGISGRVTSRNDVMKVIDMACDYYAEHEPSSPVPLLLLRAKKVIDTDFREILDEFRLGNPSSIDEIFGVVER